MSESDDYLLYVVSSRREMSWQAFKKSFDTIYEDRLIAGRDERETLASRRWRALRALDALGHCDVVFDEEGGKIYAAPPVLARLPIRGLPRAILCGARSPQTIGQLMSVCQTMEQHIRVSIQNQGTAGAFIPRCVAVQAASAEAIAGLAERLRIGFSDPPLAWGLARFSGSMPDYVSSRDWAPGPELSWVRQDFDAECLQFRANFTATGSLRLARYEDPIRSTHVHYLWRGQERARVDLDWGRYAILQAANKQVILYDPRELVFAVPSSAPLPRLLARALVLCSGLAPRFIKNSSASFESPEPYCFDAYAWIPDDIAELVASKLGQVLIKSRLGGWC